MNDRNMYKYMAFAKNIWGIKPGSDKRKVAEQGIESLKMFYRKIGMPVSLSEVNIDKKYLNEMSKKAIEAHNNGKGQIGSFKKLNINDVTQILTNCF